MNETDYSSAKVSNEFLAIWRKISQLVSTSAIINPTLFTGNLKGLNITNPQQLANALDQMDFGQPGQSQINGSRAVSPSGTQINFPIDFASGTIYTIIINCYDSSGNTVECQITNKTLSGFMAYPAINATLAYEVSIISSNNLDGYIPVFTGGTTVTFPSSISSWDVLFSCKDTYGNTVGCQIINRTSNGFEIIPAINAFFAYKIILL